MSIYLVNVQRVSHRLLPLKHEPLLDKLAMHLANDLAKRDALEHKDSLGRELQERVKLAGYDRFEWCGENLASGMLDAKGAIDLLMSSEGHRKNILNEKAREVGASVALNKSVAYWVQGYGARRDVFPVVIELEAPFTRTTKVQAHFSGARIAERMRWAWDNQSMGEWEEANSQFACPMPATEGEHTLRLEYESRGQRVIVTDSIKLLR